ncbi:MAG: HNH endonuclease [Pusillimonas sp.]
MEKPKFQLKRVSGQPVNDNELIEDLKRVAQEQGANVLPQRIYGDYGNYDISTVIRRFGTWNNALEKANLGISNRINIGDEELFENILRLWEHYGRQPRRIELANSPSKISQYPYNRRFGSWTAALQAFVDFANGGDIEEIQTSSTKTWSEKRNTGRDPSIRLRWKVLQRDNFKCCACGSSPAINPGIILHVDHIIPWSKGGETTFDNLQTLCSRCNLGKSNEI